MNIEQGIKNAIQESLENGVVEKVVQAQLEESINKAVGNIFGNWGDGTKLIEEKIKSVMIPQLEKYDYSEHVQKLDAVLTEILKQTNLDNTILIENFKQFMNEDLGDEIKMSKVIDIFTEYAEENVETSGLEVEYDDGVSFETVEIEFEVDQNSDDGYGYWTDAVATFKCEHDEKLNFEFNMTKWNREEHWSVKYDKTSDIKSLKHLNKFEIFLMKLHQSDIKLILDEEDETFNIRPNAEPEASY